MCIINSGSISLLASSVLDERFLVIFEEMFKISVIFVMV